MSYKTELERWLSSPCVDDKTKAELSQLEDCDAEDRFYKSLEFGTGGLRGIMGAGINRMNIYTVRHASQGLANEISQLGVEAKNKGVVVAYDSRNNSRLFAEECVKVLCANGIKTYLFDSLRPTPELSFAVRYLERIRGVVITASHNPKEYNGYKVYGEDGGQLAPESAKKIMAHINATDIFDDVLVSKNVDAKIIGEEVDNDYLACVREQALGEEISKDLKVVYTPIHGSGNLLVRSVLNQIGVQNLFVVPEQETPDGNFSTVISPNPEDKRAFTITIKYAEELNADVILGTDPDSDRLGVVAKDSKGEYVILNGNRTGVLIFEYIARKLSDRGELTDNATVVKTIVTTEMVRAVADKYGIRLKDVITGFKIIGEQIKLSEENSSKQDYVFGLGESYGYLKGTYARDKDAVVAAMLVAEIASECKSEGITLIDRLEKLYDEYGYYMEGLETRTLTGKEGVEQIKAVMAKFRNESLPLDIKEVKDYSNGIDDLPPSDVLKFFLNDNSWVAVRPSVTEPKIKFYFGVCTDSKEKSIKALGQLKSDVIGIAFGNE